MYWRSSAAIWLYVCVSKQPCVTQQYYWMYGFKPKTYMYMDITMFVPHILRRPCAADGMFKFKLSAPHAFSRHVSFVYMCRYGMVGQTKVTKVADLLVWPEFSEHRMHDWFISMHFVMDSILPLRAWPVCHCEVEPLFQLERNIRCILWYYSPPHPHPLSSVILLTTDNLRSESSAFHDFSAACVMGWDFND